MLHSAKLGFSRIRIEILSEIHVSPNFSIVSVGFLTFRSCYGVY